MERRERKNAVTVLAPAKLNLALDVVGLLPNGYHALDMTMQTITLAFAASSMLAMFAIASLAPHYVPLASPCASPAACTEMLK